MTEQKTSDAHPQFNTEDLIKPRRRLLDWRYMVPIWLGLIAIVAIAYYSDWDVRVAGGCGEREQEQHECDEATHEITTSGGEPRKARLILRSISFGFFDSGRASRLRP